MQEARGGEGIEVKQRCYCRRAHLPGLLSFVWRPGRSGGLVFAVRPELRDRFETISLEVVVCGRIAILRCRGPATSLGIVSLHLLPSPGGLAVGAQLHAFRERIKERNVAMTVLAGDANFVDPAGERKSVRRRVAIHCSSTL